MDRWLPVSRHYGFLIENEIWYSDSPDPTRAVLLAPAQPATSPTTGERLDDLVTARVVSRQRGGHDDAIVLEPDHRAPAPSRR
jgi:hypothetical protein